MILACSTRTATEQLIMGTLCHVNMETFAIRCRQLRRVASAEVDAENPDDVASNTLLEMQLGDEPLGGHHHCYRE